MGDRNFGNGNHGNYNQGNFNQGDHNVGDYNVGDYNVGHHLIGSHLVNPVLMLKPVLKASSTEISVEQVRSFIDKLEDINGHAVNVDQLTILKVDQLSEPATAGELEYIVNTNEAGTGVKLTVRYSERWHQNVDHGTGAEVTGSGNVQIG